MTDQHTMRIHHLQHVPFEGLGSIEATLQYKGHTLSSTHLYTNQPLPAINDIDWLIIMGGPMGIDDEGNHPWLAAEKLFIKEAIDAGKIVLGICLGAQLIASALGAKVYRNPHREIGWFNIRPSAAIKGTALSTLLSTPNEVFHWHGDTFNLPSGAKQIASSNACKNQGFIMGDNVIALQFHLEASAISAAALIEHCGDDMDNSPYVMSKEGILSAPLKFEKTNQMMAGILELLEKTSSHSSSALPTC